MDPLIVFLVLMASFQESEQWSGHYHSYVVVTGHKYVEWCDNHCWWHCCSHSHRTEDITVFRYTCDAMWTHNGDENCNIPICSPSCGSHENCVVKPWGAHRCECKPGFVTNGNGCNCPDGRTGPNCQQHDCSFNDPCYPGECHPGPSHVNCNCQQKFKGNTCLEVPSDWKATISVTEARMSFWKRGIQQPTKEEYALEIYSTENKTTKWTNMERFNWLNVSGTAMFNIPIPPRPSYVSDAGFGITDARVNIKLLKLPINGALHGELKEHKVQVCDDKVNFTTPTDLVECRVNRPDFDWLLENGDRLTLEFAVSAGGFRKLINRKTGQYERTEKYTENKVSSSVEYHFDFEKPTHSGSPKNSFYTDNEFTKLPISLRWNGWTDSISGMGRYTWEVFHLKPNGDGDLTEENKMRPIIHRGVNHTVPLVYPLPYTPQEPGMYSFILEAVDKANNSVYSRRCVLYDPESTVTTDRDHGLYISSAQRDHKGHQWISNPSTPLVASWKNHFLNLAHEKWKYLNRILPFSVQLVPGENIYKRVELKNDDHEGGRTVDAIPNARGIVSFQTSHALNKSGGVLANDPPDWTTESNLTTSKTVNINMVTGGTATFWVRAKDVLGNSKIDSTSVTCDLTTPKINIPVLKRNVPSKIPFSSRLTIPMIDIESGIDHIRIRITQLSDGHLLTNRTVPVEDLQPTDCIDKISDCYCPSALSVCYKRVNDLYISNCWLMVSKNSLQTAKVRLEVDAINRAGLVSTAPSITLTDLMTLNGTEAYFGPMDVKVVKISQSGVRVTWHHAPSCYPRTFIWLSYDDSGKMIKIHKDAESYDLTDLDSGKKYTVKILSDYDGIKSKAVAVSFKTLEAPGIGAGSIAGIIIGILLILTVLGVGFFLWRTGKAAVMVRRGRNTFERTIRRRNRPHDQEMVTNNLGPKHSDVNKGVMAYKNNTYAIDDDLYMYGSMEFTSEQPWYIPKSNLTLVEEINSGRLARIYKATCNRGSAQEVAAKVLKGEPTEETRLLMMAKINFAATQIGEHRNVLGFVGAVLDNDALGPVLVIEYCENGQLDKWLTAHQKNVDLEVLEKIQTFSLQIARGMEYLTKKGIVHRKLAARNCLLTFLNEIKIAGFGPSKTEENVEEDNGRGDRIPVKWTAPECLKSLKGANEKSDIWSYGVTLWEILSMGQTPYADVRSRDLPVKIRNGYRLGRPEYAEDIHYDLMKSCWLDKPEQRPTFTMVLDKLEASFGLRPTSGANYYYSK